MFANVLLRLLKIMIGNTEKCDYSDEEENFISSSTKHNPLPEHTKLQRIVKTLLIDVSFVAMVSRSLVQKFHFNALLHDSICLLISLII